MEPVGTFGVVELLEWSGAFAACIARSRTVPARPRAGAVSFTDLASISAFPNGALWRRGCSVFAIGEIGLEA
jgi:hypothetical protein